MYWRAGGWPDRGGALFAAAFYSFHSVHFFEIYWVSGIAQLGVALMFLLSVLLFLRFLDTGRGRWAAAACACVAAGLLAKEDAVVLPALLTALPSDGPAPPARRRWLALAWMLPAAYLAWRIGFLGFGLPAGGTYEVGGGVPLLAAKLALYAGWLLPGTPARAGAALLLGAAGLCALRMRGGARRTGASGAPLRVMAALLVVPLVPALLIPSSAEHYLNLAAAALGMLLARAAACLPGAARGAALALMLPALLHGATGENRLKLADPTWGVPVPAKAEASRQLFLQIRAAPIAPHCGVRLLEPPVDAWEKDWLIFLPALAKDRPYLNTTVALRGEVPAPASPCDHVWQWHQGEWVYRGRQP